MRRFLALITTGAIALSAGGCAASNQEAYEFAERCIGLGEYETAAEYFLQLGEYRNAADYLLYVEGLIALDKGDYELAKANFRQVAPFKSSLRYLQCIEAIEKEKNGNYNEAMEIYRRLGTFADCDEYVQRVEKEIASAERNACRTMMDQGDYAAALEKLRGMEQSAETGMMIIECEVAMEQAAYEEACALQESDRLPEAIKAFEALGNTLDAPARLAACRSELYLGAVKTEITMDNLQELIETYAALGDYLDSEAWLAELQGRHERAMAMAAVGGYVRMGRAGGVCIWRVDSVVDGVAVMSALMESGGKIEWTSAEKALLVEVNPGTAGYEKAAAVRTWDMKAADAAPVAASGLVQVIIRVDVSGAPFVMGDGSKEEPFAVE